MWIAPNLVTLLGFFFILGNVALLEVYVPDLVGPVSPPHSNPGSGQQAHNNTGTIMGILQFRVRHVDVLHHGQRRRQASASHRNLESSRGALRVR